MKKSKLHSFSSDFPHALLIRDFPPELAEKCFSFTGQRRLNRAVVQCLRDYFILKSLYADERRKRLDLQSDVDLIISYFKSESELVEKRKKVCEFISDPNRFYLHGD